MATKIPFAATKTRCSQKKKELETSESKWEIIYQEPEVICYITFGGTFPWFSLLIPPTPQAGWDALPLSSQSILCVSQSQKWLLLNSVSVYGFLKTWLCPWAQNHQPFAWCLMCNRGSMYVSWIDEWIKELLRFISGLNFLVTKARRKIHWLPSSHRHIRVNRAIFLHYFFSWC